MELEIKNFILLNTSEFKEEEITKTSSIGIIKDIIEIDIFIKTFLKINKLFNIPKPFQKLLKHFLSFHFSKQLPEMLKPRSSILKLLMELSYETGNKKIFIF